MPDVAVPSMTQPGVYTRVIDMSHLVRVDESSLVDEPVTPEMFAEYARCLEASERWQAARQATRQVVIPYSPHIQPGEEE